MYCGTISANSFFTLSLTSFAVFFKSNVAFLSIGHLLHETLFKLLYAISHVLKFMDLRFTISSSRTFENLLSSSNLKVSFLMFCNFTIIVSIFDLISSNITCPHIVLEKSCPFFKLKLSTLLSSHSSGQGAL